MNTNYIRNSIDFSLSITISNNWMEIFKRQIKLFFWQSLVIIFSGNMDFQVSLNVCWNDFSHPYIRGFGWKWENEIRIIQMKASDTFRAPAHIHVKSHWNSNLWIYNEQDTHLTFNLHLRLCLWAQDLWKFKIRF